MNRFFWKIVAPLLFLFVLLYFIHWGILLGFQFSKEQQFLLFSYLVNIGVVSFYLLLCYKLLHRLKIPFAIYLMFSMTTKLVLYFTFFQPYLKKDGNLALHEFFVFFIPYLFSLFFSVFVLSKKAKHKSEK